MDGGDQTQANSNGGPRWNPTKEQITILEGMYRQGLRTPTAHQIQQITERLKAYGNIEGKNVFYWFQNHKARQRQKQKQKQKQNQPTFGCFNGFHHAHMNSPLFLATDSNVVCSPCYVPPVMNDSVCFYQQYPKVPLPAAAAAAAGALKKPRLVPQSVEQQQQQQQLPLSSQRYNASMQDPPRSITDHHIETLDLFPIHPTGILQSKATATDDHNNEIKNPNSSCDDCSDLGNHEFIDFF